MTMNHVFNAALVAYGLALVLAVANLITLRRRLEGAATALLALGAAALTVYLGGRWVAAGRAPFSNMFESLVLFAWTIPAVGLALRARGPLPAALTAATALLGLGLLVYASAYHSSEILPLMPALRSNWLAFHVLSCLLGYGAFAVSFLAAIGYLVTTRSGPSAAGGAATTPLAAILAQTVSFGFLFLTVGIITGAVWANRAWGSYWSWDKKETWSLITWLVYAVFLHGRYLRGWSGRRLAWISILGFAAVLVTYLGVNYLMKGSLHSYAS